MFVHQNKPNVRNKMTFDDWMGDDINYLSSREARIAREAWEAGVQEGIDRIYKLYDICPECMLPNGQHKMDCSRH